MTLVALILIFINAILISFSFFKERERNSLTQLIWPIIFLFFVVPTIFHIFSDQYLKSEIVSINRSLGYAILFNASYIVTYLAFFPRNIARYNTQQAKFSFERADYAITMASVLIIGLIIATGQSGFSAALDSTWQNRSDLGFAAVIIIWLLCILSGQLCLAVENKRYTIACIILLVFFVLALLFRTRDLIGVLVISIILYILIIRRGSLRSLFVIGIAGSFISIGLRAMRLLGSLRSGLDLAALKGMFDQVWTDIFVNGDLSVYRIYFQIVDLCDKGLNCFQGTIGHHIISLTGIIDRPPVRFEYYLYDVLYKAGVGGSLHPTAYGIAYGEYALIGGCIFFSSFAVLNVVISRISSKRYFFMMVGFAAHYSIFFARGSVYNGLSVVVIGIFIIMISKLMASHTHNTRPA